MLRPAQVRAVYSTLLDAYGRQHWWPADSSFEVMVGAILTQNTAWSNVTLAINNLKAADVLSIQGLLELTEGDLAQLIRPSGYFNVKARRVTNLCQFLDRAGGEQKLRQFPTRQLRGALLKVNGIGPETADDILLYALERPVFVIDAYTRRIFSRLALIAGDEPYEVLRQGFEEVLGRDLSLCNELHALIVRHAKVSCGVRADCPGCCLAQRCPGNLGCRSMDDIPWFR